MSVRPGVSITLRSTPPPRSAPTDTGVWYVVGITGAGPLTPTLVRSLDDYVRIFGDRVAYGNLYDALDLYFHSGGERAYISRVVGPTPVYASKNLLDASSGISLVAKAIGPGSYGNSINVGVRAGVGSGTFVIFVVVNAVEVETSPDLLDTNAAVQWAATSNYIRLTLGASALDPAVAAAAALSGGDDDRANITDTQWQAALDRFVADYGIGQISAPGMTSDTLHQKVLANAAATFRTAILDAPDTATSGTLLSSAAAARAGNERFGGMFAPWLEIPGIVAGTLRPVSPSGHVAGNLARNDASGLGVGQPAAGDQGESSYASELSQPAWAESTRQSLNDGGVNVIIDRFGAIRTYGWRSLVSPVADPDWVDLGHSRLFMAIAGEAAAVGEGFLFREIDGQGKLISDFGAALTAMLMKFWQVGDIYGATAAEAFFVDVGSTVNTPESLAQNTLKAVLNVRMSPFSEFIPIEVVKTSITEAVR